MSAQVLELAVAPLDVLRRALLRVATRSATLTRVLSRRESRIACLATFQVTALFALALRWPVGLFYLGPVVFGIAHVAADVRYLLVRRAPPRALVVASIAFALAITTVQVGLALHRLPARRAEVLDVGLGVCWACVALVLASGAWRAGLVRRVAWGAAMLGGAWFLVTHAHAVEIALLHGHNLIAVGAWLLLFRRRPGWPLAPVALAIALAAVLLSGAYLPWTYARGGLVAFGTHAELLAGFLAPGVRLETGVAIACTFVFLQGVHYATWTAWIPQDALRGEGTPTFRMSVRGLAKDFGTPALALIVLAALGFAGLAAWNIHEAVGWYVRLVKAHAWFECAFVAYFLSRGAGSLARAR